METLIKQRAMSLLELIPQPYRTTVKAIISDPQTNVGVEAMMGREADFRSPLAALFAGIAMVPMARALWEDKLDRVWSRNAIPRERVKEVIVGSGPHAAIYAAIRVKMGYEPPVILEREDRAGGVFAVTRNPAFFLNSRNRPGDLGLPGRKGALNFLPGALLQPSDISGEEYMVNSDLAFIIRTTLALAGCKVITGTQVDRVDQSYGPGSSYYSRFVGSTIRMPELVLTDGRKVRADRVIVSTGIGESRKSFPYSKRVLTFPEFMKRLDTQFPLRGLGKTVVVGAGDSGKVAVEALTGLGPARHMSVASLDWMDEIMWMGPTINASRVDWEQCNRPRYKEIGTLFSGNANRPARVKGDARRLDSIYVEDGYDCVLVEGVPYDTVIDCTGINRDRQIGNNDGYIQPFAPGGSTGYRSLAQRRTASPVEVFLTGPAARIPYETPEELATPRRGDTRSQLENEVALYRYADRTAQLALVLPENVQE